MISEDVRAINYRYINATASDSAAGQIRVKETDFRFIKEIVAFVFVAGVLLGFTYFCRGVNAQEEFAAQNLRAEVMTLDRDNARLRLDVAKLEAPQRIQRIAEKKLGMTVPSGAIYGSRDIRVDQQRIKD
ncbi:MAG: cell division protein FtsL [Dialister sp.]|nr:cell division protein FtsL [Dialister sp.]